MDTLMPVAGPRLIERGFPCHQVGAETQRELDTGQAPPTHRLHVWWARRPLTVSRAAILASLSPPDLSADDFLRRLGIEQRVVEIGSETWVLTEDLIGRIHRNEDGSEVLPVDAFVLRRFEKEQQRRVTDLALAAELERQKPILASDPILQRWKRESRPLASRWVDDGRGLRVLSRAADPRFAALRIQLETAHDIRTTGNIYGYERAFRAAPVLPTAAGVVLDPTAGGGSIPIEALRLGYSVIANELNPVAAVILYATCDYPVRFGPSLATEIRKYGASLLEKTGRELLDLFPTSAVPSAERVKLANAIPRAILEQYLYERADDFLFCREVRCPSCGGEAPLLTSCWVAKDDAEAWAVRIVTDGRERGGKAWFETYRVVDGRGPDGEDPNLATVADGVGTCLHCRQAIQEGEIKDQANGRSEHGRWAERLFCVVAVRFEPRLDANGCPERYQSGARRGEIKTRKVRFFRPPNERDLGALAAAEKRLAEKWPEWEAAGLIPTEKIPEDINDPRPIRYGMPRWCDLFTPRQLLGYLLLVEELRRMTPGIITALGWERGRAVVTYLQFAIDKATDYNSKQTYWHSGRCVLTGTFAQHNFALKWAFGEMNFTGPSSGAAWAIEQVIDAYKGVSKLVEPVYRRVAAGAEPPVRILHGTAAHLDGIGDNSVDLVCIDPPYYNNVQYGELSDFYYVRQRRTLRDLYPEVYARRLVNRRDEAVANPARDGSKDAADAAYERLMGEIFAECRRVLKPDAIMTVMFTHVDRDAWEALTRSLIGSGWQISATFPVESESTALKENTGNVLSSIFMTCRKREEPAAVPAAWTGIGGSGVQQRVRRAVTEGLRDFAPLRLNPVDEMVACYGRALQVLSEHWPVIDGDEPVSPLRAMNEASSVVAASQIARLTKGHIAVAELDGETRMALTMFGIFGLGAFAWDEALNLSRSLGIALYAAAGGYEVDRRRIGVNTDAAGGARRARGAEAEAVGYAAPLVRRGSKLRLVLPEERDPRRLAAPQTDWDRFQGLILEFRRGDAPVARAYLGRTAADREARILDLIEVWTAELADPALKREAALIRFGLRPAA